MMVLVYKNAYLYAVTRIRMFTYRKNYTFTNGSVDITLL